MTAIPVLVTGAGGVYGEATIANLRRSELPLRIVGADTRWQAPGVLVSDVPVTLPLVRDPELVPKLAEVVKREGVKIVFVCSGTEIKALASQRDELERATGATFIMPTAELYTMASDKLATAQWLEARGFAFPTTASSRTPWSSPPAFPLIAKPRWGQGSRGIAIVNSEEHVERIRREDEEYVFQELLGDEDHEFTVGVVATEQGEVLASIVLRRWLTAGFTGACQVVMHEKVTSYAEKIAAELRPRGFINVQIRLRGDEPVAFEINPRVSSSTGFRALAGVNEPELLIRRYVLDERPPKPTPKPITMVRCLQERIVEPAVWDAIAPK